MEDLRLFFARAIDQALGSQPDWDDLEREFLIRQFGVGKEDVLLFRDCLQSLRRFVPLESACLPHSPGILSLGIKTTPCGVRYSDGTNIPYPIVYTESDNLYLSAETARQTDKWPRSVSYAVEDNPTVRRRFVSMLNERLEGELMRPVLPFVAC